VSGRAIFGGDASVVFYGEGSAAVAEFSGWIANIRESLKKT